MAYSENDGTGLVDEEEEENEDDEEQDEDTDDEVSETDSDLERGRRLSSDEDAMSSDSGKSYGESSKSENNKSNKTEKSTTESEDTQKSLKEDSKSSASDYNCGSSSDYEVEFGGVVCDVSTVHADGTQIVCELTDPPQAGCHYAVVTSPWGYVPIDYTLVEEICIDLVVDNVTPDRDLNPNGGDVLDVDGSGFPDNVDDVIAELDDGTPCQVISSTPTFLQCIPDKPSGLGPFCLNVYVNSLTDSYCDLLFDGINYGIEGFYPQCVSPVEDQFVTLTLDSAFPVAELDRTLFTATVQPLDPLSDYPVTNLYVASADTVNKSIDVKFNGAPTGEYEVILVHDNLGVVGSDDFIFETRSFITSVSANGGSNLGGTQLTIDGENFVADASDMMVTVDGYACDIESVTSEQIVCRVTEIATAEQGVQTSSIVVFMKLSEEALNSGSPTCGDTAEVDITWTFEEPTCSILNMDTEFDSLTNKYVVTVDGTGFIDGDLSSISLYIDDLEQETI